MKINSISVVCAGVAEDPKSSGLPASQDNLGPKKDGTLCEFRYGRRTLFDGGSRRRKVFEDSRRPRTTSRPRPRKTELFASPATDGGRSSTVVDEDAKWFHVFLEDTICVRPIAFLL
jgi:hypothetical protein